MKAKSMHAYIGLSFLGIASGWSVAAAGMAANLVISAYMEHASYFLALLVVLAGAWLFLRDRNQPAGFGRFFGPQTVAGLAVAVVIASWFLSDRQFFFWKLKTIPSTAWTEMVADLREIGRGAAESGTNILSSRTPIPKSLQRLGLTEDYSGGMANVWNTPAYNGPVGGVVFGNRIRRWGLCVGPEELAKEFCRGGGYNRVAPDAYFFFGTKD